jgi:hypothetical protein
MTLLPRRSTPIARGATNVGLLRQRLWLSSLCGLALAACQTHAPPPAATPSAAAVPGATAPRAAEHQPAPGAVASQGTATSETAVDLPSVERARLEYALDSAKLIGQDWPWLRTDATCVLLIAPTVQWVANCATPPGSFKQVGAPLLGKPVYANASDTLTMGGQLIPTAAYIAAMPATADVPLASDSTDLAQHTPWIIASSLEGLIGSHPAFGKDTSTEEWLSVFLHEFFHTRQLLAPAFRATLVELKSGKIDPGALEKLFKGDGSYRALLEREHETLSAAAARDAALTPEGARAALREWSSMYKERRDQLEKLGGAALVHANVVLTYVEGTARYVEVEFLSDPRFHSSLPLAADPHFQNYRRFSAKQGYEGLMQRKLGARYFYSVGMHLALVLDRADPTWKSRVSEEPEWIVGLARRTGAAESK